MGSCDLDAVLEVISAEYPALFSESLYYNQRDDLPFRMCSIDNNGWCWVVAQNSLHIWNFKKNRTANRSFTLNLIPNGRHYNAQDIVVYERPDSGSLPGVIAVSNNGCVRHWRNLSAQPSDTQLNLNNETLLSVSILDAATSECSARVALTTTVGSIYALVDDGRSSNGKVECQLIASYTQTGGIGSRLTNMLFGAMSELRDKPALRSLAITKPGQVASRDMVVLGPAHLTVFDPKSIQPSWTAEPLKLLGDSFAEYFKRQLSGRGGDLSNLRVFLLDMCMFRGGIMILSAGTHAFSKTPSIALGFYKTISDFRAHPDWFAVVPMARSGIFDATVESSFVGQLSLFLPREIAAQENMSYDGCVIMHDTFAQAIHPPSSMRNNEIPVNRVVFFPEGDRFIGQGCDDRNTYAFFVKKGICIVRLFPKGYSDLFCISEKTFGSAAEIASKMEMKSEHMKYANHNLRTILRAFKLFSSKELKDASAVLANLRDTEVCDGVHRIMEELLDDHSGMISSICNTIDSQLRYRQLMSARFVFFVKSMHLEPKLCSARSGIPDLLGSMTSRGRSGSSVLVEASERIVAANALRKWETSNEDHKTLMQFAAQTLSPKEAKALAEKVFFEKLTSLHTLPGAVLSLIRDQLNSISRTNEKIELLRVASDVLCTVIDAINQNRRSTSGMSELNVSDRWTTGPFANVLIELAILVLNAIADGDGAVTAMQKKSAVEQVRKLLFFAFSDCVDRPDGNDAIMLLYNIGEIELARDLAERFKDFKLLIKIAHTCDTLEETKTMLQHWKKKFSADNFDMYLCKYYRQHGLNDLLLEESGSHADSYISTCEDLRWRREIQNGRFKEAAQSLLSIADRVDDDLKRKEGLYVFAKLSALCAQNSDDLVKKAEERWASVRDGDVEML